MKEHNKNKKYQPNNKHKCARLLCKERERVWMVTAAKKSEWHHEGSLLLFLYMKRLFLFFFFLNPFVMFAWQKMNREHLPLSSFPSYCTAPPEKSTVLTAYLLHIHFGVYCCCCLVAANRSRSEWKLRSSETEQKGCTDTGTDVPC